MFDLIEGLHSDYSSYSNNRDYSKVDARIDVINVLATKMLQEMGLENKSKDYLINSVIEQDPFLIKPMYENIGGRHIIRMPTLSLIRFNEIPDKFRDTFSTDSKISDLKLLQEFSNWICDRLNLPRKEIEAADLETVKFYFRFMRDPEKAKLAVKFVFGHELAHFINGDEKKETYAVRVSRIAGFAISVGLAVLLGAPLPVCILIGVFTGSICSRIINSFVFFPFYRSIERKADKLIVTKSPKTAKGAIYFFNLMRAHQKEYRRREALTRKERIIAWIIFSPSGNNRLSWFTHYTESDRIKHIQKVIDSLSKQSKSYSHQDFQYKPVAVYKNYKNTWA